MSHYDCHYCNLHMSQCDCAEKMKEKAIKDKQQKCKHKWKKYTGYAGTDYLCEKCELWK